MIDDDSGPVKANDYIRKRQHRSTYQRRFNREANYHNLGTLLSSTVLTPNGIDATDLYANGHMVGYIRWSTELQSAGFTEQRQRFTINKYARSVNKEIDEWFIDGGVSGATGERPDLKRMNSYFIKHPNTTVASEDMSRIGRDFDVAADVRRMFKSCQARLVLVNRGEISEDEMNQETVNVSKNYHKVLTDFRDGRVQAIYGGVHMGVVPWAYIKDDTTGRIHLDPDLEEHLVDMYAWRRKGSSNAEVARTLKGMKIPAPEGGEWTGAKVGYVLKRTIHKGLSISHTPLWSWEKGIPMEGMQTRHEVLTSWTRVVPDEIWDFAQPKLRKKPGRNKAPSHPYVLNNIVCPTCNEARTVVVNHGHCMVRCDHIHAEWVACSDARLVYEPIESLYWQTLSEALAIDAKTAFSDEIRGAMQIKHAAAEAERIEKTREALDLEDLLDMEERNNIGAPFDPRRNKIKKQEESRLEDLQTAVENMGPSLSFDEYHEQHRVTFAEALKQVRDCVPLRPRDAAGLDVLLLAQSACSRVETVELKNGRFDISFVLNEAIFGGEEVTRTRTFRNVIATDSLGRKDAAHNAVNAAMDDGRLLPSENLLSSNAIEGCRIRFPQRYPDVTHAFRLSVGLTVPLTWIMRQMGFTGNMQKLAMSYWKSREAVELQKRFAVEFGQSQQPEEKLVRASAVRTIRDRLIVQGHPLLRYPPADPNSIETGMSDRDWYELVGQGLAAENGRLRCLGKKSDRRYLDAFIWLVRSNERFAAMPASLGAEPRVRSVQNALDRSGDTGLVVAALLKARGITGVPHPDEIPPLMDEATRKKPGLRNPRLLVPKDPTRTKTGRKGNLASRQAAVEKLRLQ